MTKLFNKRIRRALRRVAVIMEVLLVSQDTELAKATEGIGGLVALLAKGTVEALLNLGPAGSRDRAEAVDEAIALGAGELGLV